MKIGLYSEGSYMNHHHLYNANIWINSRFLQNKSVRNPKGNDQFSYRLNYNTNLDKISLHSRINIQSESLTGLYSNSLNLSKTNQKKTSKIDVKFLSMYRPKRSSINYLLYPDMWGVNKLNNRVDIKLEHKYRYSFGSGNYN